ncbi:MAG: NAD(P)H-hydrate epimerase [Pirellulaceae bacterium]|nr:NAD(P)H-hydrate epimerase [Pirellulaceae bacterium]
MRPLSRAEVREVDRMAIEEFGVSGLVLMENAGAGAARIIDDLAGDGPITILCGKGNNAGDGYVIARHLELADRSVQLVSIVDPAELTGDAAVNYQIAQRSELPIRVVTTPSELSSSLSESMAIIDCLLGTGAQGALRGVFADAVHAANKIDALRIAIDVPTGVDCDSGEIVSTAFRADHTITFVAEKIGLQHAQDHVGQIHVVGIGAPRCVLRRWSQAN